MIQAYLRKTRKFSNKQSKLITKETTKKRTKPQISKGKEIIKIRAELHEIETEINNIKVQ